MEYSIDPEKMIDITFPLSVDAPAWPGDTVFRRDVSCTNGFRTSKIVMSSHTGTHMDAPAHLERSRTYIDKIKPETFILQAILLDCTGAKNIGADVVEKLDLNGKALLLRTGSGIGESAHLTKEAAEKLVANGIVCVGTDSLSIDPPDSAEVHEVLLDSSVPILENLLLIDIQPGQYLLLCFPLLLESGDGSPVRAFLQPYNA